MVVAFGAGSVVERLIIKVDVDSKKAVTGMDKFSRGVGKAAKPAAAVGLAIGAMAVKAGKSASRLQQSGGAIESVFGANAAAVKEWAAAADQSVGLSESAYGELAATIGAQLKNLGTPLDQVAGKTDELIRTGADLSATYGGSTADAVAALGSALRGETDPIEKYGIAIKDATLEAAVGKDKLKNMTDAQKKQAKTTALLGLVNKQAGAAMGAFGREADTAAGQQQRAAAAAEDAAASIGQVLLPIMAKGAKGLAAFADWAGRNKTLVQALAGVLLVLAAGVIAVSAAIKVYNAVTKIMAIVSRAAWLAALGPIGWVFAGIVAVIAIVVVMYKKFDWFKKFVDKVWAAVRKGASVAFGFIKAYVKVVFAALTIYIRVWLAIAKAVFTAVKIAARAAFSAVVVVVRWASGIVRAIFGAIRGTSTALWNAVKTSARNAFSAVVVSIQWLRDKIAGVLASIKAKWNSVFSSLSEKVGDVMRAAKSPIDKITSAFNSVIGAVQRLIGWIGRISFPKPPSWLSKLPGVGSLAATAAAPAPSAGVTGGAAGLRPAGRTVASSAGGVTINVNGALDPAAVAVQIRRILRDDDRRRGRVVPTGGAA